MRAANLAQRLLRAALTQTPLAANSPVDRERIEAVEAFKALSPRERWSRLTTIEPRLNELEADVDAGRFGEIRELPPSVRVIRERAQAAA